MLTWHGRHCLRRDRDVIETLQGASYPSASGGYLSPRQGSLPGGQGVGGPTINRAHNPPDCVLPFVQAITAKLAKELAGDGDSQCTSSQNRLHLLGCVDQTGRDERER